MENRGIHSQSPRFFLCLRRGKLNLMGTHTHEAASLPN
jgi:hypothetical protein